VSELPQTWATCRLGDVVDYGATRKAEPDAIPVDAWVLELEDIEKDTSKVLQRLTFAQRQSKSTKNRFAAGDVLYGKLRPYLNKVVRADQDGFCTTEIIPLAPSHSLDGDYLFYWLKHPVFLDYVTAVSHGLNMPRLGTEAGRDAPFVLAPINEQQRIADKLDAVLARVDACRERLDRVPAILKRFRQSVLTAATSGKLTEGWRGSEQDTPWMERPLVDLCDEGRLITYGVIKLGEDVLEGVPCLRTSNVRWLRIDTDGMKRIDPVLSSNYSRTILYGGEVLVNVRGTLGGVAVAQPEMAGWNVSREVAVVPVDTKRVDSFFLAYWIGSEVSQRWLGGVEKGVAYVGINIEDLRNLPIGVPSMEEQQEIVRRVETLFAYADRLEARYQAARAQVERVTPALLAKAFRGELVPQDPDNEPASILLDRIRSARAAEPARPRQRKGGRRSGKTQKAEIIVLNRQDIERNHLTAILEERGPLTAEALWSASQLGIDDFYDQLKAEEAHGLLMERRGDAPLSPRLLEAAA